MRYTETNVFNLFFDREASCRMEIRYEPLTPENFGLHTLDTFQRRQRVQQCWRFVDGLWQLKPVSFEESWDLPQLRAIAADIAGHMTRDQSAFGAFAQDQLVGFATVSHHLFGRNARYAELVCFMVSAPFRGQGIGRRLFALAAGELPRLGADKLYISAHSSRESQAAYRALGCTLAVEINAALAAEEPFDVPLEYTPR